MSEHQRPPRESGGRGTGLGANLLLCGATLVLLLGASEGLSRLLLPAQAPLFFDPELRLRGRPFARAHPQRGFELVPGYRSEKYRINGRGLRGADIEANPVPRPWTIVAIGESTTFGWGVREGADYPSQLALVISELGYRARVINAGIPSYTSTQIRLLLDEMLEDYTPEVTLISLQWNDLFFSLVPNWYPDILVHQQPPAWQRFLLTHFRSYQAFLTYGQRADTPLEPSEAALATYRGNLVAMAERSRTAGAFPVFVASPFSSRNPRGLGKGLGLELSEDMLVRGVERFRSAMKDAAIEVEAPFLDHQLAENRRRDAHLFIDLLHPKPGGNRLMAQELAQFLMEHGQLGPAQSP